MQSNKKALVIYYSQARGNTKRIAEMIQKALGADIEAIETVVPYTGTYEEIVDQGQEEVNKGFKPEIKPLKADLNGYETIFIGTPTWWYTMAPAVASFFENYSLAGKKVVLFMTNGGWPGHVIKDMKKASRGAEIIGEKEIQFDATGGDHLETPLKEIETWLQIFVG